MVLRINARFFREQEEIHPDMSDAIQLVDSHADLLGKTAVIVGEGYIGEQAVYTAEFPDALPTLSIPDSDDCSAVTLVQVQ